MANLLKFFRSATMPSVAEQNASIGSIWFDTTNNVIKVRTAENGVDADWEVYGTSPADLTAAIGRIAALEGAVKNLNETTLPALRTELEQAIEDAVAAEAAIARKAEEDLGKRIDDLAAASVSVAEKADGHVTVSKATDDETGAVVYTIEESDIASAQGLTDEIKRAGDEEARIAGLVATEQGRATAAEKALADRLDVIEGEDNVEGSIKKAVADAKAELIGDAETLKTFGAVEDAIAEVEAAAKAAATLLTVDSEGHVTVSGKQDETTGAWTYTIGENDIASKAVVDTLVGEDKDMSARAIVQDEVAKQLTSENISDSFDTLKEMAEWLSSHPEDVQEMNDAIGANKTAIEAEVLRATTAESNLQTAIDNEVSAREAAIAALDATVGSQTVAEGKHVAVEVVETDGVLTGLTVVESDIASAAALATLDAEVQEHEQVVSAALNDLNERMTTAEGSVADHETRLAQAEADIDALEGALADKNVAAESTTPDYVTATAADNKVTVAATQKVIDAVALAETSVQTVTSDNTCLTAVKTGNNVALSLVWEEGSF